ncbi:aminotransferase family protein [Celeribacter sp. ULVN23_4]
MSSTSLATLKRGSPIQVFYSGNRAHLPTIDRANGVYLWDATGKKYLDASSGPVITNIGHGNSSVLQVMAEQAAKVCYASRAVFENQPNRELAEKLIDLAGPGFDQVFLVGSGSEATEAAIKMARQYAVVKGEVGRTVVLARSPSYHGATLGAAAVTGDPLSDDVFESVMRIMPKVPAPFSYRLPEGVSAEDYALDCAAQLEKQITNVGSERVLAFIMEPVGGLATGGLVAPDSYYKAVRDICTKHGVLLIFDEVMCGAGRTGTFLASEHWPEVRPDIVTLAKGVAAGYTPLAAVLVPNCIVEPIVASGGFLHGHTYSANPLSCAVAVAVLDEMLRLDLMSNAREIGTYLMDGLRKIADQSEIIGDVRGKGMLIAVELVVDKKSKAPIPAEHRAVYRLLEIGIDNGLLLYTRKTAGGKFGEWVMVTPPLTLTRKEADGLLQLFAKSIADFEQELAKKGLLQET